VRPGPYSGANEGPLAERLQTTRPMKATSENGSRAEKSSCSQDVLMLVLAKRDHLSMHSVKNRATGKGKLASELPMS